MNNNVLCENHTLLDELKNRSNALKSDIDTYLSKFNGDGILRLFEDQGDMKKYYERYTDFAHNLSNSLGAFENTVAVLSRLVCNADQSCNTKDTAYFSSLFEYCDSLLNSIAAFFECNNKNFEKCETFKASLPLTSTRELRSAVDVFEKLITIS